MLSCKVPKHGVVSTKAMSSVFNKRVVTSMHLLCINYHKFKRTTTAVLPSARILTFGDWNTCWVVNSMHCSVEMSFIAFVSPKVPTSFSNCITTISDNNDIEEMLNIKTKFPGENYSRSIDFFAGKIILWGSW